MVIIVGPKQIVTDQAAIVVDLNKAVARTGLDVMGPNKVVAGAEHIITPQERLVMTW